MLTVFYVTVGTTCVQTVAYLNAM